MIDMNARQRLSEDLKTKNLINGMKESIVSAFQNNSQNPNANEEVLKLVVKREEDKSLIDNTNKIAQALVMIFNQIKSIKVQLPKVFQIKGSVDVDSIIDMPDIKIKNLKDIKPYFDSLEGSFQKLVTAMSILSKTQPEIKVTTPEIDTKIFSPMKDLLEDIREGIKVLINKEDAKFPKTIEVSNYKQMVPQPVTHISINALQGTVKTTSATVGTSLVQLPTYGVLANRRGVMIFNNSANTIFFGGSDVTTSNGIPVAASSSSPIIDAGVNTVVYAIASTSGNDIRVLEVSDEASGR